MSIMQKQGKELKIWDQSWGKGKIKAGEISPFHREASTACQHFPEMCALVTYIFYKKKKKKNSSKKV